MFVHFFSIPTFFHFLNFLYDWCDVSINKSLLPIVSGAGAKIIGPCPKRTKMDNIQIIDKPYNPPQDLVIDMNAIVADLLNNLLPTKKK